MRAHTHPHCVRTGVPGYWAPGVCKVPRELCILLPPGLRADGYFMNGVPVAPDIDRHRLFDMMRPRQLVTNTPTQRWMRALEHLHAYMSNAVGVSSNALPITHVRIRVRVAQILQFDIEQQYEERMYAVARFWSLLADEEIRAQLHITDVSTYGSLTDARLHIEHTLEVGTARALTNDYLTIRHTYRIQAHLGSYRRIAACVPNELMRADIELPAGGDVTRSPLIIKLVPLYRACNGDIEHLGEQLLIAPTDK